MVQHIHNRSLGMAVSRNAAFKLPSLAALNNAVAASRNQSLETCAVFCDLCTKHSDKTD